MSTSLSRRSRSFLACGVVLFTVTMALLQTAVADTYAYDAQGRVTTVTYASGLVVIYTYDSAGNRTSVSSVSGVPLWGTAVWGSFTWTP